MAEIPFNEKVGEAFKNIPRGTSGGLPDYLGIEIFDVGPGTMRARLAVRDEFLTRFGNMHGGVLSSFCDHMLGCVCYPAMGKGQWAATTEFKINLTAPVKGGTVEARAEILNLSRSQAVVRIDMDNDGRACAMAQGTVTIHNPR